MCTVISCCDRLRWYYYLFHRSLPPLTSAITKQSGFPATQSVVHRQYQACFTETTQGRVAMLSKPDTGTTNSLHHGMQFGVSMKEELPTVCVRMRVRWNSACRVVERIVKCSKKISNVSRLVPTNCRATIVPLSWTVLKLWENHAQLLSDKACQCVPWR